MRIKGCVVSWGSLSYRRVDFADLAPFRCSINNIAPKPRKILQLLRLLQINNGVFVKVTKATSEMLLRVEPYITYGEVSLSTVRQLVYKRGYGKVNKQRVPLSSNAVIEQALGKYGILSIEDLIHEIVTAGPAFKAASSEFRVFRPRLDFWPPEVKIREN